MSTKVNLPFMFSGRNLLAQRSARQHGARMVTVVSKETQRALALLIRRAIREGIAPMDAARLIESMVGMNARQAVAAMNHRESLVELGLTPGRVDTLMAKYVRQKIKERGRMIARTELNRALSAGLEEGFRQAQIGGYLSTNAQKEWIATAGACPICEALDGQRVFIGQDFSEAGNPPAHPHCLASDCSVLARNVLAATERLYEGTLIEITTALGHRLSCSPNHPIATPRGLIPAQDLDVGSEVLSDAGWDRRMKRQSQNDDMPARIQDVAQAFVERPEVASSPTRVSAVDFHGDGEGSKVAVVWTDGRLRRGLDPLQSERFPYLRFNRGQLANAFSRLRSLYVSFVGVDLSSSRLMGGGHLCAAHGGGRTFPFQECSVPPLTGHDTVSDQERFDGLSVLASNKRVARQRDGGFPFDVTPDDVVRVGRRPFGGHIFNLETASGYYLAAGIASGNCRCTIAAVAPAAVNPGGVPNLNTAPLSGRFAPPGVPR